MSCHISLIQKFYYMLGRWSSNIFGFMNMFREGNGVGSRNGCNAKRLAIAMHGLCIPPQKYIYIYIKVINIFVQNRHQSHRPLANKRKKDFASKFVRQETTRPFLLNLICSSQQYLNSLSYTLPQAFFFLFFFLIILFVPKLMRIFLKILKF